MSYKGKKNQYTCNTCGKSIVTVDSDEGTTSLMLTCRATNDCEGLMYSSMYQIDQSLTPEWEWYKPKNKKNLDSYTHQHVEMGGLLLRKIQTQ